MAMATAKKEYECSICNVRHESPNQARTHFYGDDHVRAVRDAHGPVLDDLLRHCLLCDVHPLWGPHQGRDSPMFKNYS
jgi:hypothetical protein